MDNEARVEPREQRSPNVVPINRHLTSPIRSIFGDPQPYSDEPLHSSAMYSSKGSRMHRLKEWRKSRSRRFWILVGSCVLSVLLLIIFLPYFLTRPEPASLPERPGVIPHSYMVDIKSANDEETRLAVFAMYKALLTGSTETKSLPSWMLKMSLMKSQE